MAIVNQQFPDHASTFSPSTYALSCLLHDIGATDENIAATHMSFEFYGGIIALNLLTDLGAPRDQAEAVCETIIRHQDLGTVGNITFLGQVIQLATIYDNVTAHPDIPNYKDLLAEQTRDDVNATFPREGWLGCFAAIIRKETGTKPWCHTTHIHDFDRLVEGNKVMRKYE
jgi:cyanamide hydratase